MKSLAFAFIAITLFPTWSAAETVTLQVETEFRGSAIPPGSFLGGVFTLAYDTEATPSVDGTIVASYQNILGGSFQIGGETVTFDSGTTSILDSGLAGGFFANANRNLPGIADTVFSGTILGKEAVAFNFGLDTPSSSTTSDFPTTTSDFLFLDRPFRNFVGLFFDDGSSISGPIQGPDKVSFITPDAPAPVPLPGSAWLMIGGLGTMAAMRRRKRRKPTSKLLAQKNRPVQGAVLCRTVGCGPIRRI